MTLGAFHNFLNGSFGHWVIGGNGSMVHWRNDPIPIGGLYLSIFLALVGGRRSRGAVPIGVPPLGGPLLRPRRGSAGASPSHALPAQGMNLSGVGPILWSRDQAGANWVVANIIPLGVVTLLVSQPRIPVIGLPAMLRILAALGEL